MNISPWALRVPDCLRGRHDYYTPSLEHGNFFRNVVCWKPIWGDPKLLGESRKLFFEILGWAVFEIWTMWFLVRVLGGPLKFFRENIKYVKSNLSVSPFSYSFRFRAQKTHFRPKKDITWSA